MTTSHTSLKRTLTLVPLVLIGLAYMDPLVVFNTYGVVAQITNGHVPTAYLVILAALLFTAYSYGKMVQAYPSAGSVYTYTQESIHPTVGFLVGWAVLLDYVFLPMVNLAIGGVFLSAGIPQIPITVWVPILAAIVTTINIFGIRLTANVTALFVTFQTIVLIVFVGLVVKGLIDGMGMGTLLSASPFYSASMELSLILTGASVLCISFLGFDAVTTLSEETINPTKTLPRAILLIILLGGILFTGTSYVLHLVYPDFTTFRNVDAAALEIALYVGGAFLHAFFLAGTTVAIFSSSLSAHASASRLLYAMGRKRTLPRLFAYVHPKFKTPVFNIVLIGSLSLIAVLGELEIFYSFINFGALIGFLFVNLSVIAHYYYHEKRRQGWDVFRYLVVPGIGAAFTLWLFASLHHAAMLLGALWLVIGTLYTVFILKKDASLILKS